MKSDSVKRLTVSALLIAVGIVIPMFSPLKVVVEPASFTLASHVAIFIAMMLSPGMAVAVAVGTTAGFFVGGFPIVVVLRAATHVVFAGLGALFLQRQPRILESPLGLRLVSLVLAVVHAACEVAVVSAFYFGGEMGGAYYQQGFLRSVLLLVGLGSVVHSMADWEIALVIRKVLARQKGFTALRKVRDRAG